MSRSQEEAPRAEVMGVGGQRPGGRRLMGDGEARMAVSSGRRGDSSILQSNATAGLQLISRDEACARTQFGVNLRQGATEVRPQIDMDLAQIAGATAAPHREPSWDLLCRPLCMGRPIPAVF